MEDVFCKDCRFCRQPIFIGWEFARCEAPQNSRHDMVSGETTYKFAKYCSSIREDANLCGNAAKWFVATHDERIQ
jgi:hypothetical protein